MAVTDTGRMFIWGRASYGRLGLEGRRDAYGPEELQLPGGTERWKIAAITCGGRHSMCLAVPVRDQVGNNSGTAVAVSTAVQAAVPVSTAAGGYSNGAGVVANGASQMASWFTGNPTAAAAAGSAGGIPHSTSTGSMASLQQHQQQQGGYNQGSAATLATPGSPLRRGGSTGGPLPPLSPLNKQQQVQGQQQQVPLQSAHQLNIAPPSVTMSQGSIGGVGSAASLGRYQLGAVASAAVGNDGSLRGGGGSSAGLGQGEEQRSMSQRGSRNNLAVMAGEESTRGLADGEAVSLMKCCLDHA